MNKTFKLTTNSFGLPIGYKEGIRVFKGETDITIDISVVHLLNNPIIKMDIDFNDDTEILTKCYDFAYPTKIAEPIVHTFSPDKITQNVIYFPTVFMKFLNGDEFIYQCPIKISKSSFYNDYFNLNVGNAQFIDNSINSLFCTLDTAKGDILNIKIK